MSKRLIASFLIIIGLIGGSVFWFTRPEPPIETKFVPTSPGLRGASQDEVTQNQVEIKGTEEYVLLDNPRHVYQTFNNCGAATLSMILSWYGENVSQKELGVLMAVQCLNN